MTKLKPISSKEIQTEASKIVNELNKKFRSYMGKEQHGVEIIPGLASNSELMEVRGSRLPQAIVFDVIPLTDGTYSSIKNVYTHLVNSVYNGGQFNPTTQGEVMSILSTVEYVFSNRVKYFIMILVQSSVSKMKKRFSDIDELKLYESIMYEIDKTFGNVIYYLESYIGDRVIVTRDSELHLIIAIDTAVYNCLLDAMVGYPLDIDGHDFISTLVREFDMIISDYFDNYILNEVELIYKPQLDAAIKKGIEFNELEAKAIPF
ncbi:MAG: hypothetical protein M0P49_07070 [Bacilli bacterium]|nr:hypothetical protein [Bacilli bacterium]